MILSFADAGTRDIFHGADTRAARRCCPRLLWPVAWRKLTCVHEASDLAALRSPPGNRLERLKGDRLGMYSIRVNDQYRLCFRWSGHDASDVEIADYH
jgi:proteic killer suppression protein